MDGERPEKNCDGNNGQSYGLAGFDPMKPVFQTDGRSRTVRRRRELNRGYRLSLVVIFGVKCVRSLHNREGDR